MTLCTKLLRYHGNLATLPCTATRILNSFFLASRSIQACASMGHSILLVRKSEPCLKYQLYDYGLKGRDLAVEYNGAHLVFNPAESE